MDSIDPELKYCLHCQDEYRAEMEVCAICSKDLISGALLKKSLLEKTRVLCEITENDTVVTVRTGSLFDMKNLKRTLEKSSVPAIISSDSNCRGGCCGPQVMLQIRAQDVELAQKVLSIEHEASTRLHDYEGVNAEVMFDPSATKTVCPACGHGFVPDGPDCPECGLCFV